MRLAPSPVRPWWIDRLEHLAEAEVRREEPLAPRTSIRVGGSAELFVRPHSPRALVALLRHCREEGVPISLLGGGANTLIGDGGITGVTLKIPTDLYPEELSLSPGQGMLTLCAGAAIARLIQLAKNNRLVGAEFLAGIPGTIGGAAAMNAGTRMGECITVVDALEVATFEGIGWIPRAQLAYEYRRTLLPRAGVVTRVRFALPTGDLQLSQQKMDEDLGYRKRTQPLNLPNFGSVFQNPPGNFAGRLIEEAGLKGHTSGRAQISALHGNFIVNLGGATAQDVVSLIELAQSRVRDRTGIELKPEVKRVGVFS
jgi:UDP-N-acetylmuramate dehydrogenase